MTDIAGVRDQGRSFVAKAAAGCGGAVLHRDAERLVKRDLFR
jgi:hypothetical protein